MKKGNTLFEEVVEVEMENVEWFLKAYFWNKWVIGTKLIPQRVIDD